MHLLFMWYILLHSHACSGTSRTCLTSFNLKGATIFCMHHLSHMWYHMPLYDIIIEKGNKCHFGTMPYNKIKDFRSLQYHPYYKEVISSFQNDGKTSGFLHVLIMSINSFNTSGSYVEYKNQGITLWQRKEWP